MNRHAEHVHALRSLRTAPLLWQGYWEAIEYITRPRHANGSLDYDQMGRDIAEAAQ